MLVGQRKILGLPACYKIINWDCFSDCFVSDCFFVHFHTFPDCFVWDCFVQTRQNRSIGVMKVFILFCIIQGGQLKDAKLVELPFIEG